MLRLRLPDTLGLGLLVLALVGSAWLPRTGAQPGLEKPEKEKASMLSSSPVIAFVATKDPGEAKAFYQDVLKLKLTADEPFALVFDANGTMLRVSKVKELTAAP
jgi:hypothetical protein